MEDSTTTRDTLVVNAAAALTRVPITQRRSVLVAACSFLPHEPQLEWDCVGIVRAAFAETWERLLAKPVSIQIAQETAEQEFLAVLGFHPLDMLIVPPEQLEAFFLDLIQRAKPRLAKWQAYVTQIRRQSCPGCGDDGCFF